MVRTQLRACGLVGSRMNGHAQKRKVSLWLFIERVSGMETVTNIAEMTLKRMCVENDMKRGSPAPVLSLAFLLTWEINKKGLCYILSWHNCHRNQQ